MNPGLNVANYSRNTNSYKQQEILSATPEQCVIHLYDVAIQSCILEQGEKAAKAVAMLIDALDFNQGGEIASRLFGLYGFCIKQIHEKEFEMTLRILRELRETWSTALKSVRAA